VKVPTHSRHILEANDHTRELELQPRSAVRKWWLSMTHQGFPHSDELKGSLANFVQELQVLCNCARGGTNVLLGTFCIETYYLSVFLCSER
jgi:hypothetical protein